MPDARPSPSSGSAVLVQAGEIGSSYNGAISGDGRRPRNFDDGGLSVGLSVADHGKSAARSPPVAVIVSHSRRSTRCGYTPARSSS